MADQETHSFFGENRSLFSDYYLRERLHTLGEWDQDISGPFSTAMEIYRDKKSVLPGMNEAQTENEFVQPVLEQVLDFSYDVQKAEKKQGRTNIPDYILFPDADSLKEAQQKPDNDERYYNNALALSDAKYWDRPLDSKGVAEKDRYTNANPSFQIVNYLTVTGLEWGILTNGSRWRLYSTRARSRIDSYFEVDLQQILEEEDQEQFRYFYHFFRRQAFQSDPETGQSFIERIFEGSIDYGTRLEKRLKGLIFDEVFLQLSKGFVHYRSEEEGIEQETEESLQQIYQGTLRLLYRLLFLLHAESRSLLPLDNKGYLQHSLMELKKKIAGRIDNDIPQVAQSFDVWNDLDSLFNIIDKGAPEINVPRYNGGLFRRDHPNNRFLREHKISDKYLVPALEKLTRETEPNEAGRKPFIDYKSLNVEQLGSIYEGLLEFHLRQDGGGNGKELYLENDKGERKATGSYYTPHYIVEYIVENTLGPVFEERKTTFRELMEQWVPKYEEFKKLDRKIREGDKSTRTHNRRKELHLEVESLGNKAAETLLSIKVCDPAMGSGHFLKEATDKLAEKIITLLAEYPTNPVTNLLEDVRGQILESLEEQDISIDSEEHLKDTNLIKRMVMKRSIYGVDLNPMAVELAKLSLWLDSFTVGAPLSFLDHHLKVGNSLIGTTVGEIREQLETGQSHMFGGPFSGLLNATELMREVSVKTDATYSEVEQSIARYHDFEEAVAPYKKVLDIWLSRHFDNERAGDFLVTFSDQITHLLKGEDVELGDKQQAIIDTAEQLNDEKHFFHWELEFPEVFVDLKQSKWLDNPGFDAVVGNPPYIRIQELNETASDTVPYLKKNYKSAFGSYDLYLLFVEKGQSLLQSEGIFGYILPNKFFQLDFGQGMRELFTEKKPVREIIDLNGNQIFEGQTTYTCLLFLQGSERESFNYVKLPISNSPKNDVPKWLFEDLPKPKAKLEVKSFTEEPWLLVSGDAKNLIDRLESSSKPFNFFVEQIFQGLISGSDKIYSVKKISSEDSLIKVYSKSLDREVKLEANLLKPLVSGKEVDRYKKIETDHLLIFPYNLTDEGAELISVDEFEENYPLTWEYLQLHEDELRGRESGKLDDAEWYRYSRTQSLDKHEYSKLCTARLVDHLSFTPDYKGDFYLDNVDVNGILLDEDSEYSPSYLTALLNSKLLDWRFKKGSVPFRGGFFSANKQFIADLPIFQIDFSKFNPDENAPFPEQLEQQYQQYLEGASTDELLDLTEELINDDDEYRLPVIHDFLADLAGQMLEYNKEKQRLEDVLNPFDFLNKGVRFGSFKDIFRDAIKYGKQLTGEVDIGTVHHDIEELRLKPDGDLWLLSAQLKHRDPDTGWDDWIKEDEHTIARSTHDIYRFELSDKEARYWQQAFEVLDEFENSGNFPGGKTRSTFEKLMKSEVPVFDESANIEPLIELREELAAVKQKIEKTDWLIDQVVYRLYGLSEEEVEVVEESI